MDQKPYIMHIGYEAFRGEKRSRTGRGTIAYTVDGCNVKIAMVLCSPNDVFKRKEGFGRAMERLQNGKTFTFILPEDDMKMYDVQQIIIRVMPMAHYFVEIPHLPTLDTTALEIWSFGQNRW